MTLISPITEEAFNALNDILKGEYKKGDDNKFHLDVDGRDGWGYEHVEGLRRTKDEERNRREKWEKDYKKLRNGLSKVKDEDLDTVGELFDELERLRATKGDSKQQAERLTALENQYKEKLATSEKTAQEGFSQRDRAIRKLAIESTARQILGRKEVSGNADLLLPHIEKRVKTEIDPDTGGVRTIVIDAKGDPLLSKKPGNTGPMELEELLTVHMKKDFPSAYTGVGASGGGAGPNVNTGTGGSGNSTDMSKLSPQERLKQIRRQQTAEKT